MSTLAESSPRLPRRATLTPARVYAMTRMGLGLWLLIAPEQFGAKWFTAPQDPTLTGSIVRAIGGRDFGVGLGLLLSDRPLLWLLLAVFCDVLDTGLVLMARSKFTDSQTLSGVIGALSYAAVGAVILLFTRRHHATNAKV